MAAAVDLSDVAVIVSVKVDSPDRAANLARLRDYYARVATGAEIVVVEQGPRPALDPAPGDDLRLLFREDPGCHWKTRNMNLGASVAARPRLLMSDCDTVPHPAALAEGLARLDAGAGAVQLYNGVVMNLSRRLAGGITDWDAFFDGVRTVAPEAVAAGRSCTDVEFHPLYGDERYRALGGALLCTRAAFFMAGGWNERLVGYGYDDRELDLRLRRLGVAVVRLEGWNLYHFEHARGIDSRYGSAFYRLNEAEFRRVADMTPAALRAYVDAGFRVLRFDHGRDYLRVSTEQEEGWRAVAPRRIDLSDLVILVLADAREVRYWASCLAAFLDHLEQRFHGYEVRLCEVGDTDYKHIHSKMNIVYRCFPDGVDDRALAAVLAESGRPLCHRLRLRADAAAQLQRATAPFARVSAGVPPAEVFAAVAAGDAAG